MTRSDVLVLEALALHCRLSTTEIFASEMQSDIKPTKVKLSSFIRSSATVRKRLKVLSEKNLIIIVKEKPCPNKKIEKWYDITTKGLIALLEYEEPWNYIEQIVEVQHAKIPLIFEKWNIFSKLKNELNLAVKISLKDSLVDSYLSKEISENQLAKSFSTHVLFAALNVNIDWTANSLGPLYFKNKISDEWMQMMSSDPELIACFFAGVENLREKLQEALCLITQLENSALMFSVINQEEKSTPKPEPNDT